MSMSMAMGFAPLVRHNHSMLHAHVGNGCVIKVSEYASASASDIEHMFGTVLAARGYDPELVQVITGYAETGAALINCGVDKVNDMTCVQHCVDDSNVCATCCMMDIRSYDTHD